ncbi:hypothetical protein CRG98_011533 [Punica granatum]|uniref:Uncharacterized protein n=1 Tax=Punica granatum TaxID=22663 RepID=A0A2I0KHD0_PUNGR|nr:hypothetical protein CRG98_011533 [Punica granatum]
MRLDSAFQELSCRASGLCLFGAVVPCVWTLAVPAKKLMCLEMAVSCPSTGEESALGSSLYCVWTRGSREKIEGEVEVRTCCNLVMLEGEEDARPSSAR